MSGKTSHHDRARALLENGRQERALRAFRDSMLIGEAQAEQSALMALAVFDARGDAAGALDWLVLASRTLPRSDRWLAILAERQMGHGHFDAAITSIEQALALNPDNAVAAINRACWLAGRWGDGVRTRALFEAWSQRFLDPLSRGAEPLPARDWDPARRLRIGYVSGDLKNHSVRYFIEGYLREHDRAQFEVHAFMTLEEDAISDVLRPLVDCWHPVQALDDDALLALIRRLEIDVLIDLSGHTRGERLAVFARRAAPVQATWFGFMQTLGMRAMDWRITDFSASPQGSEACYTERLWRLQSMVSYTPPLNADALYDSPWRANGYVTMVCLNHSRKISDVALQAWARILSENPASGLMLISSEGKPQQGHGLYARLQQHGMPADRVIVLERQTMAAFLRMASIADFALDPFPVSGGTTTLHALWTGLPTVALDQSAHGGMQGAAAAIQKGCFLDEVVATSVDDYVALAGLWIREPERIDAVRARCRPGLLASSVMQHAERTRELEAALRGMWRDACATAGCERVPAKAQGASTGPALS